MVRRAALALNLLALGCGDDDAARVPVGGVAGAPAAGGAGAVAGVGGVGGGGGATGGGAAGGGGESPCPRAMVEVPAPGGRTLCMDRFEAPNHAGELPLVMYSMIEAEAWCAFRGKRLCTDAEWEATCAGPSELAYPYGDVHQPGVCNDDETWLVYDQSLLNGWPPGASNPTVESLAELFAAAASISPAGEAASEHVAALYQAEPAGENVGCASASGVMDLCGNVEEWTRRADGGAGPSFTGNLKGRYWAEPRTCQSNVTNHADAFRFYEIGFRCCIDAIDD